MLFDECVACFRVSGVRLGECVQECGDFQMFF